MAAVRSTLPSPDWSFRLRPEAREIQSLVSLWLLWLDFIIVFLSNYLFILKLFNFFYHSAQCGQKGGIFPFCGIFGPKGGTDF